VAFGGGARPEAGAKLALGSLYLKDGDQSPLEGLPARPRFVFGLARPDSGPVSNRWKCHTSATGIDEAKLDAFMQGGFTRVRRATETPLNLIIEARP
jgi:hypothetical protein